MAFSAVRNPAGREARDGQPKQVLAYGLAARREDNETTCQ